MNEILGIVKPILDKVEFTWKGLKVLVCIVIFLLLCGAGILYYLDGKIFFSNLEKLEKSVLILERLQQLEKNAITKDSILRKNYIAINDSLTRDLQITDKLIQTRSYRFTNILFLQGRKLVLPILFWGALFFSATKIHTLKEHRAAIFIAGFGVMVGINMLLLFIPWMGWFWSGTVFPIVFNICMMLLIYRLSTR